MMDNNDKLLNDFFAANRQEIADNGFSRRVMHRLPDRRNRLAQLWEYGGFILAAALFILLDGAERVWNAFCEVFISAIASGMAEQIEPKSLLIAVAVLLLIAYRKIASLA